MSKPTWIKQSWPDGSFVEEEWHDSVQTLVCGGASGFPSEQLQLHQDEEHRPKENTQISSQILQMLFQIMISPGSQQYSFTLSVSLSNYLASSSSGWQVIRDDPVAFPTKPLTFQKFPHWPRLWGGIQ